MAEQLLSILRRNSDRALFWLIPLFLLIDGVNGALLQFTGNSFALSALYKLSLLTLMAVSLATVQPRQLAAIVVLLLLLLLGPALYWPALPLRWPLADLQLALKAVSPLLAFYYLYSLQQREPDRSKLLCRYTLYFSALILLLNTLAGLAGFGFTAYQPLDGVAQSFLGIKGFFYSTNELSAVLLVLSCALLLLSWPRSKVLYGLLSALSLMIAVLLLTKTGLFGVLLLVVLIPLLMQQRQFWQQHKLAVGVALVLLLLSALLVMLNGESLLRLLGIYDKLVFVYQQRGISGILLSSRDYYAEQIWQVLAQYFSDWQRALGVGQGSIALYLKKYFAELDWFDLLVFHGVAGLAVLLLTFSVFLRHSWQVRNNGIGRCLLLLNLLLLLVSSVAGHIITSGMLWLPWALCNALLLRSMQSSKTELERA
ncbi:MAG TPA: O-antigen ligase family protein [Rheinheimera sp.]|nr:O-antigen ligase family protein [Rheinheimera sp.]